MKIVQNVAKHPHLDPSGLLLQLDQQDPGESKIILRHDINNADYVSVNCVA